MYPRMTGLWPVLHYTVFGQFKIREIDTTMIETGIRNAMKGSCDECGKEVIYEKDDDSGLASIEVEPTVWKELCEECATAHRDRERAYLEEENGADGSVATFERPDLE